MNIGANIYSLRKVKKLTQAQLAEKLGVSEQAISKWENGGSTPDVSLFPVIADLFGVSIDRLFGHSMNTTEEVRQIIAAADDSMDTYKEIEIVSEGLRRYPNSADLKLYLAFSLSMVNRISKDENERKKAVDQAVRLCHEVTDICGETSKIDGALNMLTRIYTETGHYQKAEECLTKLSADCYDLRIVGMTKMLRYKKCYREQEEYAEESLWKLYWTMSHVFDHLTSSLMQNGEHEKTLAFLEAHEKLLSIFDSGCPDFYTTDKLLVCRKKAKCYMKLDDKENCLESLHHYFQLAEQAKKVAKNCDFHIAARNPLYFSSVESKILEEYITDLHPETILSGYDKFFGDNPWYAAFKKEVLE